MSSYDDYRSRIIAAQEQWNRERDTIYDFSRRAESVFRGEFEPPRIPGPDGYELMDLPQMRAAVDAMRPDMVRAAAEAWTNIGMNLTGAIETFNKEFARTVTGDGTNPGWTGQSGPAAINAVGRYAERSQALAGAAGMVGLKLSEMHTGLEQTQALMPQVTQRPTLKDKTLPPDGLMKDGDYTEDEAKEEARRILRTVYAQVANQTDNGVPVLPAAPPIVDDAPPAPGTSLGSPNSGAPQAPSVPNQPGTPGEQPKDSDKPGDNPAQQPGTQPASTTPQSADQSKASQQPGTTTNPTTPSSTNTATPNSTATPSSPSRPTTPGSPNRPGSPARPGSPGRPSTPGIPGTLGAPGAPGRSVPGAPQQPGVAPAAARAGGPAGRPGVPGTPGMAPAAAGRGKDDERTKSVPDYLISQENGNELTGLDVRPKAVPPVIGGD
ncbi:hypothetical protein [Nocardia sp. NPDC052566]|uniref:hypothetical protein n=1 Tax=Nocardia sp. NPDC052566 TaxID=3364330 RepID=UPI0037C8E13D